MAFNPCGIPKEKWGFPIDAIILMGLPCGGYCANSSEMCCPGSERVDHKGCEYFRPEIIKPTDMYEVGYTVDLDCTIRDAETGKEITWYHEVR